MRLSASGERTTQRRPRAGYVEATAVVGLDGDRAVVAQHRAHELGDSGRHALDPAQ